MKSKDWLNRKKETSMLKKQRNKVISVELLISL